SLRYLFSLFGGELTISQDAAQDDISKFYCTGNGFCLPGELLQNGVRNVVLQDLSSLPDKFDQTMLDAQSIQVAQDPGEAPCNTDADCPDASSAVFMQLGLIQGASQVGNVFSMSSTQESDFLTSVQAVGKDARNWRCAQVSDTDMR